MPCLHSLRSWAMHFTFARLRLRQIIFIGALINCLSLNNPLIATIFAHQMNWKYFTSCFPWKCRRAFLFIWKYCCNNYLSWICAYKMYSKVSCKDKIDSKQSCLHTHYLDFQLSFRVLVIWCIYFNSVLWRHWIIQMLFLNTLSYKKISQQTQNF